MNITRIFLIRHGQTYWNVEGRYQGWQDTELSPLGLNQSNLLADYLTRYKFAAIYASPLKRAVMTAEICGEKLGLKIIPTKGFMEISHGIWEGQLISKVKQEYPDLVTNWQTRPFDMTFPKGESFLKFKTRVLAGIEKLFKSHQNKNIAVITHDLPIRVIISQALGIDQEKFWKFKLDNTGVTIVEIDNENCIDLRVTLINGLHHLAEYFTINEQRAL